MEEILELKELIQNHDYKGALSLVEELEEMSFLDIRNNIRSYAIILLLHLIKQEIEKRSTSSWDDSINYSILEIKALNRRRKGKGTYLDRLDLEEMMGDAFALAVIKGRKEIFKGKLSVKEIAARIDENALVQQALDAIGRDREV